MQYHSKKIMNSYTIHELAARYGISKGIVNARIKHLKIETELVANRVKVLEVDVNRLDGLDAFLKQSKSHRYNDYIEPTEIIEVSRMESELAPREKISNEITNQNQVGQINLFDQLATALIEKFKESATSQKAEVIAELKTLAEVANENWILSTSQVLSLIGIKPRGKIFVRGSFTFTRICKLGAESGWLVSRTNLEQLMKSKGDD